MFRWFRGSTSPIPLRPLLNNRNGASLSLAREFRDQTSKKFAGLDLCYIHIPYLTLTYHRPKRLRRWKEGSGPQSYSTRAISVGVHHGYSINETIGYSTCPTSKYHQFTGKLLLKILSVSCFSMATVKLCRCRCEFSPDQLSCVLAPKPGRVAC